MGSSDTAREKESLAANSKLNALLTIVTWTSSVLLSVLAPAGLLRQRRASTQWQTPLRPWQKHPGPSDGRVLAEARASSSEKSLMGSFEQAWDKERAAAKSKAKLFVIVAPA